MLLLLCLTLFITLIFAQHPQAYDFTLYHNFYFALTILFIANNWGKYLISNTLLKSQIHLCTKSAMSVLCLSITLLENRWRLFGHILRRNSEIPANKSMNSYFISHGSKFRGRPLTTLPVVLNKDLTRVSDDTLQLTSLKDLDHLRSVAQNRQTWRKLTTRIREAAEASPSDDWDAEGPKSSKSNYL